MLWLQSDPGTISLIPARLLQAENVLILDMDLPDQTTKEYQEPVIAPKVAAALKDALRDEDEIEVDASHLDQGIGLSGTARSSSSSLRKPSSRYLVTHTPDQQGADWWDTVVL